MSTDMQISVIDSHTGGEPTRLVVNGAPDLGSGPVQVRLARFREKFDHVRAAIVNEPRGSDAIVGALLCEPHDPSCRVGVIFFNNVGYLGMCGHGTIGLVATLAYMKRVQPGKLRIETPVGIVGAELHGDGFVTVQNVPGYRFKRDVSVEVPGYGNVTGDIAWGGNWFFLVNGPSPIELSLQCLDRLTDFTWKIRKALEGKGITGENGRLIDHIELYGPARDARAGSRNFVLCPGGSYDRSPCGTGTSAKVACLYSDGKLKPGERWLQESITGSLFEAHVELQGEQIVPFIKGSAFITSVADLIIDERDPFRWGIPA